MNVPPDVYVLSFVAGKYRGEAFALGPRPSYIAGRSSEADLVLADDAVSRKHVRFYRARSRVWLRDLGSQNGTIVNGVAVDRHCLRDGDRIALGSSLIRVERKDAREIKKGWAGERRDGAAGQAMSGTLADIPLVDVIQWLATSRKTGTLKVQGADRGASGELVLRDGQVCAARIEGRAGLNSKRALLRMLGWSQGRFALDSAVPSPAASNLDVPLEYLLMEAARLEDELQRLRTEKGIPSLDDDVTLTRPSETPYRALSPDELDIVEGLATGASWLDLLDRALADDVVMHQRLVALRGKGVVTWGS